MSDIDKLAREIAAKTHSVPQKEQILSGAYDRTPTVKAARLGILEGERRGMEKAAAWHDARCKGPNVFEQELHEISASAIRAIAANPELTSMEALESAQAIRKALP